MGGPSDKAQKAAAASEADRQNKIRETTGAVNAVYDNPNRKAEIADYVDAMRTYYGDDLSRQKTTNDRELRFALARSGQTGGSTQIDQQRTFGENYGRGLLEVDRKARGAGAELESADQDSRLRLIQMASAGLDSTTGAQQAAQGLRSTLEAGRAGAMANGLGDAFSAMKPFYQANKDAAVRRRADKDAFGLYAPTAATSFNYGGKP